jgi:hypothetical protein
MLNNTISKRDRQIKTNVVYGRIKGGLETSNMKQHANCLNDDLYPLELCLRNDRHTLL